MRRSGLLIVMALLIAACERGGGVGVVNLESVARALGRDTVIEQQLTTKKQELAGQLQQVARQLSESAQAAIAKTPDQRPQIEQQAQQRWGLAQQQAQQNSAQYQSKLVGDFRNEVKTAAQKIAEDRGLSVILQDTIVIWNKDTQDITDDVTKALRSGAIVPVPAGAAASPAKPAS